MRAPAPCSRGADIEAEIAWARGELARNLRRPALSRAAGEAARLGRADPFLLYLFNDDFACRAATLFPYGARVIRRRRAEDDDASEPRPMTAKIVGPSGIEDGRTLREVTYVTVDFELSREDGSARSRPVVRMADGASPTAAGTEFLRRFTARSPQSTIASRAGTECRRPYGPTAAARSSGLHARQAANARASVARK